MKAAFTQGDKTVALRDLPIPKIGGGEILVKMSACGICGTDIEKVLGVSVTPPVLGHEVCGEVVGIGADVHGIIEVGDRVFVHHHVSCGLCYYCRHGSETMCEDFLKTNLDPCGFSEYFRVPGVNVKRGAVLKLPDRMGYEEGTFVEPLACCIRGLMKSHFKPGDSVLVVGTGAVGLLHMQLARAFGASLVMTSDLIPFRLEMARRLGADLAVDAGAAEREVKGATSGRGADVVIVATGNPEGLKQGLACVRRGGKVNIFGAPPRGTILPLDLSDIFVREVSIWPSYSTSEVETNVALTLLSRGRIDVRSMITHTFDLGQIAEAFRVAMEGERCLKVVVGG